MLFPLGAKAIPQTHSAIYRYYEHKLGGGTREHKVHQLGGGTRANKVHKDFWQVGGMTGTGVLC